MPHKFIILIISAVLLLGNGCSPKANTHTEYHEQSPEETSQVTKAIFTDNQIGQTIKTYPEIEAFFSRFSQASRSDTSIDAMDFLSIEAMMQSMDSAKMLDGFNFIERRQFKKGLTRGLQSFGLSMKQMAFVS